MVFIDRHKDGRVYVYAPNHPRCNNKGYVKRSIIVMETFLGRSLNPLYEHVHHINGDKTDDRIENLMVLSPEDHVRYHHQHPKSGGNGR
jgi:hypothetical protein